VASPGARPPSGPVAAGAAVTPAATRSPSRVPGPQPAALTADPNPGGTARERPDRSTGAAGSGRPRRPDGDDPVAAATVAFGPWRCGDEYSWDLGHPVLARPCHATGPAVRAMGQIEAAPGVQVDVSLTVRNAGSDEVVAGPYDCKGLMFTDFALKQSCGPVDLNPPRGGRYVVAESWRYTERPLLPAGSARGPEFTW